MTYRQWRRPLSQHDAAVPARVGGGEGPQPGGRVESSRPHPLRGGPAVGGRDRPVVRPGRVEPARVREAGRVGQRGTGGGRSGRSPAQRPSRSRAPGGPGVAGAGSGIGCSHPAAGVSPLQGAFHGHLAASCSIFMRVHLVPTPWASAASPPRSASPSGTVVAVDIVESHPELLVVDLTCNAVDARHAGGHHPGGRRDRGRRRPRRQRPDVLHLGGKLRDRLQGAAAHPRRPVDGLHPGVARVCRAIAANPADARKLTIKRNTVAVVTDGSAVLGLGNIGPEAAMPVMEGKALLFKQFAGVDALASLPGHPGHRRDRPHGRAPRPPATPGSTWRTSPPPLLRGSSAGCGRHRYSTTSTAPPSWSWPPDQRPAHGRQGAGRGRGGAVGLEDGRGRPSSRSSNTRAGQLVACDRNGVLHKGREGLDEGKRWVADHTNPDSLSGTCATPWPARTCSSG